MPPSLFVLLSFCMVSFKVVFSILLLIVRILRHQRRDSNSKTAVCTQFSAPGRDTARPRSNNLPIISELLRVANGVFPILQLVNSKLPISRHSSQHNPLLENNLTVLATCLLQEGFSEESSWPDQRNVTWTDF